MITPKQTSVQVLGPAVIASPLQLAHRSGQGPGAFVPDAARVRYQIETATGQDLPADIFFEKAGPRETLFFEPRQTKAAIITCGGVCPGLNNVVRSAVMEFYYHYGVRQVYGIRYGCAGLNPKIGLPPIELTPKSVSDIHEKGGTILGSSRGQQPSDIMAEFLVERRDNRGNGLTRIPHSHVKEPRRCVAPKSHGDQKLQAVAFSSDAGCAQRGVANARVSKREATSGDLALDD